MANSINATSTGNGGIITTGDDSGVLNIQTNETTAISIDASQNLTFTNPANLPNTFGFKNRLINGNMLVWQRGTSFSVSTTTVTYGADRWGIYQPSGTGTITQDTDTPTGFKYSLKAVGAGTDILQRIESTNASDLSGATVTVSFWLKQTVGAGSGSMTVSLQYANSSDNWTSITAISSSTVTATSSWAQYSVTFTNLPSGVTNGLAVNIFPTSSGSSATYFLTGVQLEKGTQATSFDFRSYGTELALCQRYYQLLGGGVTTSGNLVITLGLFCPMRATPTVTTSLTSGSGASFGVWSTGQQGFTQLVQGGNNSANSSATVTASAEL